jgi:hypothetical protein
VYYSVADSSVFQICRAICDGIEKAAEEEKRAISQARAAMGEGGR